MSSPDSFVDAIRSIFAFIDSVGYLLLTAVYKIFFTVANAQILDPEAMMVFFSRIQLILGVLMTFKLAMTILNIIINPDAFKDKEKGAGKLLMRIAISLILLTLIVPINIPENSDSDLNEQIRTNGILFGFLNQFQYAVLQDNILGKLILGSTADSNEGNYGDLDNLSDIGMTLSTTVAQAFISPTLKENVDAQYGEDGRISPDSVACPEVLSDYEYGLPNTSYKDYIKYINDTCDSDGKEVYIFEYTPFAGLVCSLIMTVIIIGFTLDVAVRAIKLAVLRLIAPIPIISYISPGQEKNGVFGSWVKTLASTYADLFLRLIIIYFGAYVILLISTGGINIWQNSPDVFTNLFSSVFIMIGVLVFMKQAPKFFQDMLGFKGDGKLFSGIGTMLGAAALTGGLVGSVASSAQAGYSEGQEMGHGKIRSTLGAVGAGAGGLLGGAYAGGKALLTNDKKVPGAVYSAMQKRNAIRAGGSTLFGRGWDKVSSAMTGYSPADILEGKVDAYGTASGLVGNIMDMADADGDWKYGNTGMSVKELKERAERLKYSGASEKDIKDADDLYKQAQAARVSAVLRGEGIKEGNFAPQMWQDYQNLRKINERYNLGLLNNVDANLQKYEETVRTDGKEKADKILSAVFKAAKPVATNEARNIKNSRAYTVRKVNKS